METRQGDRKSNMLSKALAFPKTKATQHRFPNPGLSPFQSMTSLSAFVSPPPHHLPLIFSSCASNYCHNGLVPVSPFTPDHQVCSPIRTTQGKNAVALPDRLNTLAIMDGFSACLPQDGRQVSSSFIPCMHLFFRGRMTLAAGNSSDSLGGSAKKGLFKTPSFQLCCELQRIHLDQDSLEEEIMYLNGTFLVK